MKHCPYEDVPVGAKCTANLEDCWCTQCNHPIPAREYGAIYLGHITDGVVYHRLQLRDPFPCSNCGKILSVWARQCEGGGEWPIEAGCSGRVWSNERLTYVGQGVSPSYPRERELWQVLTGQELNYQ